MENQNVADVLAKVAEHLKDAKSGVMVLTLVDDGTVMRLHSDALEFRNSSVRPAIRLIESHFAEPRKVELEPLPLANLAELLKGHE